MGSRGTRIVIVCEDEKHRSFALQTFNELGQHYRVLRCIPCPPGRGAAEQWVRQRYAEEVCVHRRRASSQRGLTLVVIIDADMQTVDFRHKQLADVLNGSDQPKRGPNEPIVIWVPKRNIETWVADLLQGNANEEDDYKNKVHGADYQLAANRFVDRYRNPGSRPPELLPSMSRAFEETARVTPARRE